MLCIDGNLKFLKIIVPLITLYSRTTLNVASLVAGNKDTVKGAANHKSNSSYTFRLRLFDNEISVTPWVSYPRVIEITKRLHAEVQLRPINNSIIDEDLMAIPTDCFFSMNSNPAIETRKMVIESGCSVNKSSAIFYKREPPDSPAVQQTVLNHALRFSVYVERRYFPSRIFMFFHCKTTVCSLKGDRPAEHIKMCPTDDFCTKSAGKSTADPSSSSPSPSGTGAGPEPGVLPSPSAPTANVFSGPLRPVLPPIKLPSSNGGGGPEIIPSWTVDGNRRPPPLLMHQSQQQQQQQAANLKKGAAQKCPPCPVEDNADTGDIVGNLELETNKNGGNERSSPSQQTLTTTRYVARGIDTLTVFCIAASSFFVGVFLMASLCYVHKITEPKKCLSSAGVKQHYQNQQRQRLVDPSCSSTLLTINNYNNNLYREQQQKLSHHQNNNNNNNNTNNLAETTASTNCEGSSHSHADTPMIPGGNSGNGTVGGATNFLAANSVLLLAKPKLKLPCCYDPVDQSDNGSGGDPMDYCSATRTSDNNNNNTRSSEHRANGTTKN